jgi:hypothetical protein
MSSIASALSCERVRYLAKLLSRERGAIIRNLTMVPASSRWAPFAISFTVTCVFFINFCAWIFQCGCQSLWAGADALCNVHLSSEHRCPWCAHGIMGYAVVMTAVSIPQLAVSTLMRSHWLTRAALGLTLGAISGALMALAFGWMDGYWR